MITRISKKPEIVFRFLKAPDSEAPAGQEVALRLSIHVPSKNMHLCSDVLLLDRSLWDDESVQRLEELTLKILKLVEAMEESERRAPPSTMEPIWDNESLEKLQELTVKIGKLQEAREECERRAPPLTMEQPIRRLSEAELQQKSVAYREWSRHTEIAEMALRRGVAEKQALEAQVRRLSLEQRSSACKEWQEQNTIIGDAFRDKCNEKILLEARMGSDCIPHLSLRAIFLRNQKADERSYILYRGAVWCSDRDLNAEQWQTLADRYLDQQDAELASALGESKPGSSRERIAPEVRRAVWIRDKGKCARCDSRERLEYDHIVPLSRGGSNTERNIELLCENCNRSKSDRVE